MSITADHPAWLCVAIALLLAAIIAALWARRRSWRWRAAGILLPLIAATLAASAIANIALASHAPVLILLDFSPSARNAPWHNPDWVRALAQKRLGSHALTIAAFDGETCRQIFDAPSTADPWPARWDWDGSASGDAIARALAWRLPNEQENALAPRWIITDGIFPTPTTPSSMAIAWTIVPPQSLDSGITDIALQTPDPNNPSQVHINIHIRLTGPLPANNPTHVRLTLDRDGTNIAQQTIDFNAQNGADATERWVTIGDQLPQNAAAAPHTYHATATLLGTGAARGDAWPENDAASAIYAPPTERRTLVVAAREPTFPHTAFVQPEWFLARPNELAAQGWQTIILDDLPQLAPGQAEALAALVRDNGTGLLIVGGPHAFGPGHYGESDATRTLEDLSPVWSHPQNAATTHVVFLIDASASMNDDAAAAGAPPERRITVALAGLAGALRTLAPDDRVTVIAFNGGAQVVLDDSPAAAETQLTHGISIQPAGPTNPDVALPQIAAAFTQKSAASGIPAAPGAPALQNVLILLTDGEIPSIDIAKWRGVLAAASAHLIIIAPPPPDATKPSLLRDLAVTPGASWLQTPTPTDWRDALSDAVGMQTRGTLRTDLIRWTAPGDEPLTGESTSWTRVWHKSNTTLTAQGTINNETFPLAVFRPEGLGRVGAIALSNDNSPAYAALLDRMARTVAAPPGDHRFTAAARRATDGTWDIAVDGVDTTGFINGETLTANTQTAATRAASPSDVAQSHRPFTQTGPGHYEASTHSHGPLVATIVRAAANDPQIVARITIPDVQTDEWPASAPTRFDPAVAHATVLSPSSETGQWNVPPTGRTSLQSLCWLLSALAALSAMWLRR